MSASYGPICQEMKEYLRVQREEPQRSQADPRGSFQKSLECGCRWCSVACKALGNNGGVSNENKIDDSEADARLSATPLSYYAGTWETRKDKLTAEFRKSGINFSRDESASEVFVLEGDDTFVPIASPISGNTGSEKSFRTASRWLQECISNHTTLCSLITVPPGPGRLPRRVIDVTSPIRLIETGVQNGYYTCLSHCWGKEQPLTTTRKPDTLSSHQRGIPWENLPKTFQEAVQATRTIGFQYIWIDSLCIIQDDDKDWEIESARMADIYQNAVITFAGSASSGHSEGLFRAADPQHIHSALTSHATSDELEGIRKRKPLPHDAENLPLMHRGWVFQERLLSARYLHFGQNELIWECMEQQTCECGGLDLQERTSSTWLAPKNRLHPNSLHHMQSFSWTTSKAWHAAVNDYSRTNLTRAEDIFPAISGLVKNVQKVTGWTYVAGLWEENLIIDLVWKVEHPEFARRCKTWRAPTFSWASIISTKPGGSSISYVRMNHLWNGLKENNSRERTNFYAKFVNARCKPKGADPTGQIDSGHITLSGTLIKANLRRSPIKRGWDIAPVGREALALSFFHEDYNFENKDCDVSDGDAVFCLKLIGSSKNPNLHGEYLLYLVLKKIDARLEDLEQTAAEWEYERIGLLRDARGEDDDPLEARSNEHDIQCDVQVRII